MFVNEANLLKLLNHEHVIKFYEAYLTKKNSLCIIMEYAESK